jgi:DNA invertase Pin-like site-specific DNA recombinase
LGKILGYIRVSTDTQDLEKQRHLLLEYAHKHKFTIDEMIEVEVSSRKDTKTRKIDMLLEKLSSGDTLLVAELSRLGRNMLEVLNLINALTEKQIKIIFIRQPELSTTGTHGKLLLAIYSYFAETEREFISIRTKQGLEAAKAQGKMLGRPPGSRNKAARKLDPYKEEIEKLLGLGVTLSGVRKIVNSHLDKPVSYSAYKFFMKTFNNS